MTREIKFYVHTCSQQAAVPVKKSRLPEEEEEREGRKEEEDEDNDEALKKARDFDDFKDGE